MGAYCFLDVVTVMENQRYTFQLFWNGCRYCFLDVVTMMENRSCIVMFAREGIMESSISKLIQNGCVSV